MLEDGSMYEGEWDKKKNQIDGKGVKIFKDGSRYDGNFVGGLHHGYGRMVYPEGDCYIGEWNHNEIEGLGTYTYQDGVINEGFWVKGIQNGRGKEIAEEFLFEGNFEKGVKEGQGKFTFHNRGVYTGEIH